MEGGRHRRVSETFEERRVLAGERTRNVLSTPSLESRPDCHPRQAQDDLGCRLWYGTNNRLPEPARLRNVGDRGFGIAIRNSERPDLIHQHDLRFALDLKRFFDLVWCLEVAEYIRLKFVSTFVDNLAAIPK
jgi:hypothetical protein